jgi:ankyrin repeat protein
MAPKLFESKLSVREQKIVDMLLIKAAQKGEPFWVESLLAEGANPDAIEGDSRQRSALMVASEHGVELASMFISAGADPNYISAESGNKGNTCLHEAVGCVGGDKVALALLAAGADPCARAGTGYTALQAAVRMNTSNLERKAAAIGVGEALIAAGMPQKVLDGALHSASETVKEWPESRRWIMMLAKAGANMKALCRGFEDGLFPEERAAFESSGLAAILPAGPKSRRKRM